MIGHKDVIVATAGHHREASSEVSGKEILFHQNFGENGFGFGSRGNWGQVKQCWLLRGANMLADKFGVAQVRVNGPGQVLGNQVGG